MENCRSISTTLSATAEKEGDRSDRPEVSAELATKQQLLRGLFTWPRIGWTQEWRHLSSPKPWQFQKRVTTSASNVSHDICMVTLVTFNGTPFRMKRKQLF